MKRIALSALAILAISIPAFSTIHTVCNMPYSPGQHTTYEAAEAVAADGDTIYVHGSSFDYGHIEVDKGVVIIGAGFHPNKQLPLTTTFGSIDVRHWDVQLIGLTVYYVTTGFNISNIAIRKCRFLGTGPGGFCMQAAGSGWLIEGNVFDAGSVNWAIDCGNTGPHIIQHNIFAIVGTGILRLRGFLGSPAYVLNNVFLGDSGSGPSAIANSSDLVVRNNIFAGLTPYFTFDVPGGVNSIEKNLTYACFDNNFNPVGSYPNNILATDPDFVAYGGTPVPYSTTSDFRLNPSSPGHNYGTDGTDIGVFGGVGELFTTTGEPSIAEITAFDITSPTTVAPGGTLTISVTSKRVK